PQHVNKPRSTRYVDEVALCIEKKIVCVAAGIDLGSYITSLPIKCCEFRRTSKNDKHALSFMIERHREISAVSHGPTCPLLAGGCINSHDASFIWQVHKYLPRLGVKLKTFWVSVQRKALRFAIASQINDPYGPVAVADKQMVYGPVNPNVV